MEQLVIAMLFAYPGALVEICDKYLHRYSYRKEEIGESANIAKGFVYSVFITLISIFAYARLRGKSVATLADIIASLTGMVELGWYVGISLLNTFVFTVLLHNAQKCALYARSWWMSRKEGVQLRGAADAWHELAYGKEMAEIRNDAILRITEGDSVTVGFAKYWPDSLNDGILLVQSDIVKQYFEFDGKQGTVEEQYIGPPWYTFHNPENGMRIEVFDGRELKKHLGI